MADKIETNNKRVASIENISASADTNVVDNVFCSGDPIGHTSLSLADVYEYKRKELDKIHQDLNELMARLNSFIADQDDFYDFEEEPTQQKQEPDNSEKQDGPPEKELIKQIYYTSATPEEICLCDGEYPPGVDWDILAPFVESVVGDLKRIRQLNQMTNSVMDRIRCLTSEKSDYNQQDDEKK